MHAAYRALCGLALAGAVVLSGACGGAPSTLQATWKDPTASKVKFKKIIAIAINSDEVTRRSMETAMAQKIPYFTTAPGSVAAARAIEALAAKPLEVRSLQEFFPG